MSTPTFPPPLGDEVLRWCDDAGDWLAVTRNGSLYLWVESRWWAKGQHSDTIQRLAQALHAANIQLYQVPSQTSRDAQGAWTFRVEIERAVAAERRRCLDEVTVRIAEWATAYYPLPVDVLIDIGEAIAGGDAGPDSPEALAWLDAVERGEKQPI